MLFAKKEDNRNLHTKLFELLFYEYAALLWCHRNALSLCLYLGVCECLWLANRQMINTNQQVKHLGVCVPSALNILFCTHTPLQKYGFVAFFWGYQINRVQKTSNALLFIVNPFIVCMSQHTKKAKQKKTLTHNFLLSDRHSSSAWLNASRKFMLLLSGVLGLEHFRKLFEQIINKHSGGDKTITHTLETGHPISARTHTYVFTYSWAKHATTCIQFTLFHIPIPMRMEHSTPNTTS